MCMNYVFISFDGVNELNLRSFVRMYMFKKPKKPHPDKDAAKCHNNNLSGLILLCFDYS